MKRINNYLNLPVTAQRALDRYWMASDALQDNVEDAKAELIEHFNYACDLASETFKNLGLDFSPFFKPVNF